mgnify:CR=1 FL=1
MRISTNQIYEKSLNAMLDQQAGVNNTQLQLATGRRILKPSDDPTQSARILDLSQALATNHQYQLNADTTRYRSSLEDNNLGGVVVGTLPTANDGTRFLDVIVSLNITHTWLGDIVATLNRAANEALKDPEVKTRFATVASEPIGGSPADLQAMIAADRAIFEPRIKALGLKAQ